MEINPYAAPAAHLEEFVASQPTFYVVSLRKFTILFVATLGLYELYWFYANWKGYRDQTGEDVWPVPRAIFSVFFAHSLFSRIQEKLSQREISFSWTPGYLATMYVVFAILTNILDRIAVKEVWSPEADVLSLLFIAPVFYALLTAQKAVNLVEGNNADSVNDRLTWVNAVWIVLGLVMWALTILNLLIIFGVVDL